MLTNKKTIVALTVACLSALNDATMLEQCCNGGCDNGSDVDTEEMVEQVGNFFVEDVASLTAELKALQEEFKQYKLQVESEFTT